MAESALLSTAQVAEMLGKPVGTINRWAAEGKLPIAMKLPGRTGAHLFRREDVEALKPTAEAAS